MKLEDIKQFNLPECSRICSNPLGGTLGIGKVVGEARISTTAQAWIRTFHRTKKEFIYEFLNSTKISQHGHPHNPNFSVDRPKRFLVFIYGIVHEGEAYNLAYATSMLDDTEQVNVVRLTNLDDLTKIENYNPY
jgi:hypothetical protein